MTVDAYVVGFVAQKLGVTAHEISGYRFEAEPGRVWSEYTEESFECKISVQMADGSERLVHMWAAETCEFLNGFAMSLQEAP